MATFSRPVAVRYGGLVRVECDPPRVSAPTLRLAHGLPSFPAARGRSGFVPDLICFIEIFFHVSGSPPFRPLAHSRTERRGRRSPTVVRLESCPGSTHGAVSPREGQLPKCIPTGTSSMASRPQSDGSRLNPCLALLKGSSCFPYATRTQRTLYSLDRDDTWRPEYPRSGDFAPNIPRRPWQTSHSMLYRCWPRCNRS